MIDRLLDGLMRRALRIASLPDIRDRTIGVHLAASTSLAQITLRRREHHPGHLSQGLVNEAQVARPRIDDVSASVSFDPFASVDVDSNDRRFNGFDQVSQIVEGFRLFFGCLGQIGRRHT